MDMISKISKKELFIGLLKIEFGQMGKQTRSFYVQGGKPQELQALVESTIALSLLIISIDLLGFSFLLIRMMLFKHLKKLSKAIQNEKDFLFPVFKVIIIENLKIHSLKNFVLKMKLTITFLHLEPSIE